MNDEDPEFQKKAIKYLRALYAEMESSPDDDRYIHELGGHLGFSFDDVKQIVTYLLGKGLIKHSRHDKYISITKLGREWIEKEEKKGSIDSEVKTVPCIFISHINEDSQIAIQLKNLLITLFSNRIEIFVSSDKESIPYGKEWFPPIKQNLINCKLTLILCSPNSIRRPWINFEAGASAILDRPTIPLCYGGQKRGDLPEPLSYYRGANADDIEDLTGVIKEISRIIGSPLSSVDISQSDFFVTVSALEEQKPADKPHITAGVKSTSITKGENVVITGSTSYPDSMVQIELFKFGDEKDKMIAFSAPTGSDGSFQLLRRSDSFEPGQYGVTIQQPNGEWTKLLFKVKDDKK
jgi:DNA-binding MarR family transcriptional regulator